MNQIVKAENTRNQAWVTFYKAQAAYVKAGSAYCKAKATLDKVQTTFATEERKKGK